MDRELIERLRAVLDFQLIELAGRSITVATVLVFLLMVLATLWASRLARRAVRAFFQLRGVTDQGTVGVADRLIHYAVLALGFGLAVHNVGINLSALFAAGAVFAVALGFATQNIMEGFLAGVILLVERSIKPGDVLEIEGRPVKVATMGIRATIVRTKDDEDLIVPNTILVSSAVKNYTLRDTTNRLRMQVGVVYRADMDQVREVLSTAASSLPWRLSNHDPEVQLLAFADSSVNFEVSVWHDDPWAFQRRRSDLHFAVWRALKDASIEIAFPQLDVHFDAPVAQGLAHPGVARLGSGDAP